MLPNKPDNTGDTGDAASGPDMPVLRDRSQTSCLRASRGIPIADIRDVQVIADDRVGFHGGYRLELHGAEIGRVERHFRTIERKIKGKRYVAWRRKAKRPEYRAGPANGTKARCRTLHDAVHHVFAQAMSAFGQDPQGLGAKPASAVAKPCAHTPEALSRERGE